jgi:CheY-like chemotaxis protein
MNLSNPPRIILLLEDDASYRRVIERMLKRAGHGVITADNGAAALKVLGQTSVDLLLLDIYLPEMDGFELLLALRRLHPELPVLAISGGGLGAAPGHMLEQCRKLGARAVLAKPFSEEELIRALAHVFVAAAS